MDKGLGAVFTLMTGIVSLATLAVLVSRNAQTPSVISAGFKGLSDSIGAAVAPVMSSSSVQIGK